MSTLSRRLLICLTAVFLSLATTISAQETTETVSISTELQSAETDQQVLSILMVPLTSEELAEVANAWQGIVHAQMDEIANINLKVLTASATEIDALRTQLSTMTTEQFALQRKYQSVLKAWGRKGGAAEDLESHENYLIGLKESSLQTTDSITLLRTAGNWMIARDGGLGILIKIGTLIVAVWVLAFVAKFIRRVTQRGLEKIPHLSNLLKAFILTVVYWLAFAIGIMVVLAAFGVNVGPLFALLGGLSFILAFALQDTLGNLASGLMIMILKPFDTDDYIHTAGTSGIVVEMSIISTKIRTFDNQIIVIPNSKIWGDVITNVNASDTRRVDMVFGIAYSDSADHAIGILKKLLEDNKLVLKDPAADVFVGELADSSVNIFCRSWVKTEDYWTVYWDMLARAKTTFEAEGISIPFPQRDIHVHQITADASDK
ncbi:mechanosensitive ion channel family protein [Falsihalocynthiibacter sp. BN13B15]|uniref:mechanosensitive ion channel family protein n=1 Tax=Falsihalocynthiibacter sp. BN13B15 TaxID=3240871 RepID=UPI0035109FB6